MISGARGKDFHPRSPCQRVVEGVVYLLFSGSRVTTDQRVVAKQEIQEVESAKRAGASYAHHRNQEKDTNMKLRQKLANATTIFVLPSYGLHLGGLTSFVAAICISILLAACANHHLFSTGDGRKRLVAVRL